MMPRVWLCAVDETAYEQNDQGSQDHERRGLWTHALQGLVVSVLEHLKDVLDQGLFDFSMAWDRLADTRSRVLIPIVPSTVSNEDAAVLLDLSNEVARFMTPAARPHDGLQGCCRW